MGYRKEAEKVANPAPKRIIFYRGESGPVHHQSQMVDRERRRCVGGSIQAGARPGAPASQGSVVVTF
jgi:hypothetical protein